MNIGVIIPSIGLEDKLYKCLKHLRNQSPRHRIFPVIIDNGTPNWEVLKAIEKIYDIHEFIYVRLPWNTGFARASNTGIHVCGQVDAFLFLNNDCYLDSDCLEKMLDALLQGKGDVIGAKLRYLDGDMIQHAGGVINGNWESVTHIHRGMDRSLPEVCQSREMAWVTAACMLVRAKVFVENGGFDENYINGYEDVDFCLRIKEKGKKIYYCAQATGEHEEAQTPGRKDHEDHNAKIFFSRWRNKRVEKFQP